MNILNQYLKKLGLSNYEDLNQEERKTYEGWENTLKGRKITDKDVTDWLIVEKEKAIERITNISNLTKEEDIFFKMEIKFIGKILNFLNGPNVEKVAMQNTIEKLLN